MTSASNIGVSSSTPVSMNGMSSSRFDLVASIVAFIVAVTIGVMIWKDVTLFDNFRQATTGDAIATVSDMTNIVRRKTGDLPVWKAASQEEKLNSGDYVFTDRGSTMKLTFVEQGQVELGENTMIQIDRSQDNTGLKLMQGTMRADARKGGKSLVIKLGTSGTVLKAGPTAEVQIQTAQDGQASVAVLSGHAELMDGTKVVSVSDSQAVSLSEAGEVSDPKSIPLRLLRPTHEEAVYIPRGGVITFDWQLAEDVDVMFELSRDALFKDVVFRERVTGEQIMVEQPAAGVHYWRIIPADVDAAMVESRTLTVVINEPPTLLWPENQAVLEKVGEEMQTRLVWQGGVEKHVYDIEISRTEDFSSSVLKFSSDIPSLQTPPLVETKYYWRVKKAGEHSTEWSGVSQFSVQTLALPDAPKPLAPEHNATLTLTVGQPVHFQWQPSQLSAGYVLEVSSQSDFAADVETKSTVGSEAQTLEWMASKFGNFYWRVRALDVKARNTAFSPTQTLRLEESSEAPLPPPDLNDEYEIEAPSGDKGASLWEKFFGIGVAYAADGDVQTIKWPAVANAQGYFVQIAQEESFKKVLKEAEVYVPQYSFDGFKPGTYFLRIATLDKRKSKGTFSKPVRVLISYPAPRLVKPIDKTKLSAGEATEFDWRKVDGASSYRVEFGHDSSFKKVVRTETPRLSSVVVKNLEPGAYFWRVTALFPSQGSSKPSAHRAITVEKKAVVEAPPQSKPVAPAVPVATVPPPPQSAPTPLPVVENRAAELPPLERSKTFSVAVSVSPSSLKYSLTESKANLDIHAKLLNSYMLQARAPIARRWEMQFSLQRTATEMFKDEKNNPSQKRLPVSLLRGKVYAAYGLKKASALQDRWFGIRLGVAQQDILRFRRSTLRSIDVEALSLLGPTAGVVAHTPMGKRFVTTLALDYALLQNAQVEKGSSLTADVSMQQNLNRKIFLYYGLRHDTGRYTFKHSGDGSIREQTSSLTLGAGSHF